MVAVDVDSPAQFITFVELLIHLETLCSITARSSGRSSLIS